MIINQLFTQLQETAFVQWILRTHEAKLKQISIAQMKHASAVAETHTLNSD